MTKKKTRFQKVSDLMADVLPDDPEFVTELEEQIDKRRLVRGLATLRNCKNVSQADIADVLGCGQSRISKLENGYDSDVRMSDIEAYAKVLGCDVQVVFGSRELSIVDEVKIHAFRIKDCFGRLAELAKSDEDVARGVAEFHIEALFNLAEIVKRSSRRLPKRKRPGLRLTVPENELSHSESQKDAAKEHAVS